MMPRLCNVSFFDPHDQDGPISCEKVYGHDGAHIGRNATRTRGAAWTKDMHFRFMDGEKSANVDLESA